MKILIAYQNPRISFLFESAQRNKASLVLIKPPEDSWEFYSNLLGVVHIEELDLLAADMDATLAALGRLCEQFSVQGCLACVDEVVEIMTLLAKQRGFVRNSISCAYNLKTKPNMRRAMATANVASPHFLEIPDHLTDLNALGLDALQYPYVIKPSAGFASMGVTRVDDSNQLLKALAFNRKLNRVRLKTFSAEVDRVATSTIAEQFIGGDEYIVDGISCKGQYQMLTVTHKGAPEGPYFEDTTHITAADLAPEIIEKIYQTVSQGLSSLCVENGPSHTEIRIFKNEVYILETANRVGGSGVCDFFVRESTGHDYYGLIFAICTGQNPVLRPTDFPQYKKITTNLIIPVGSGGKYMGIEGADTVAKMPGFFRLMRFFKPGTPIPEFPDFVGFPGFVLGVHDEMNQGHLFMQMAMQTIRAVYDRTGG